VRWSFLNKKDPRLPGPIQLSKLQFFLTTRASAVSPYYGIDSITDLFSFHFSGARALLTYLEFHKPVSAATARTSSNVSRTRSPRLKRLKRLELLERPHLNDWNRLSDVQRFERSVAIERLERFEPHSFDLFFVAGLSE
jgi:hypothetical protein